jgi:hypothetical protein
MTARKGKGSASDVSYAGGRAGQRIRQFAIERGIDVPPVLGGAGKKTPLKKAATKALPRGTRKKTS